MKDIPSFKCYNDDTYVELVFDTYSLTLGGYMSINHPNGRIQDDVKELLYSTSINDFNTSELCKDLEKNLLINYKTDDYKRINRVLMIYL